MAAVTAYITDWMGADEAAPSERQAENAGCHFVKNHGVLREGFNVKYA